MTRTTFNTKYIARWKSGIGFIQVRNPNYKPGRKRTNTPCNQNKKKVIKVHQISQDELLKKVEEIIKQKRMLAILKKLQI